MIGMLASTFRYCVSKERMVPIYEELENIKKYVQLCKIRFGSRLEVEYSISDTILDFMIPRMLLQGLVENSVKYAVETTNQKITIRININTRDEKIYIHVSDDGPGISRDRLLEIIEDVNNEDYMVGNKKGIGLANLCA